VYATFGQGGEACSQIHYLKGGGKKLVNYKPTNLKGGEGRSFSVLRKKGKEKTSNDEGRGGAKIDSGGES